MQNSPRRPDYRVKEAAAELNIAVSTLWRYVAERKIKVIRYSRRCTRIPAVELDRFRARCMTASNPED